MLMTLISTPINILVETNLIFLYGRSGASFKQTIVGTEHPKEI